MTTSIGTGETHSVREFVEAAVRLCGSGLQKHVKMSERYFRPLEVGMSSSRTPSKARTKLGWQPRMRIRGSGLPSWWMRTSKRQASRPAEKGKAILEKKDRPLETVAQFRHEYGASRQWPGFPALMGQDELLE